MTYFHSVNPMPSCFCFPLSLFSCEFGFICGTFASLVTPSLLQSEVFWYGVLEDGFAFRCFEFGLE